MVAPPEEPPPAEGYVYELCKAEGKFRFLFLLTTAGTGLMLIWLTVASVVPSLGAGEGTLVVAVINLTVAGSLAVLSGYVMRRCAKRKQLRRDAYRDSTKDS